MPTMPATQYKVAGIVEVSDDVQQHDELIFDIRSCSNAESFHGNVLVVHHYIGHCAENSADVFTDSCCCCFDG